MDKNRELFQLAVLERDDGKCVVCKELAKDVHHLIERRLWKDGGYHVNNGVSLCEKHHIQAEQTLISVEQLREFAGIKEIILPEHMYDSIQYDKWGNEVLKTGQRLKGELFDDDNVQKVLKPVMHLFTDYVKYPRTFHLPWSEGMTRDDRMIDSIDYFKDKEVVVTLKMDGENATFYNDYLHSRSLEFVSHPSREYIKTLHAKMGYLIPKGMRICGENLYAKHAIEYKNLDDWFFMFGVWEGNKCLSWDDTLEYIELLNLKHVPVLYRGNFNEDIIKKLYKKEYDGNEMEGYVVRLTDSFHMKDFRKCVGKYVRKNHVGDHGFWMNSKITINKTKKNMWKNI